MQTFRVRRAALLWPLAGTAAVWTPTAAAQNLAGLSELDAGKGLKGALELGAAAAVQLLGKPDGFLGNPLVRIGLPGNLKDAAKLLQTLGLKKQLEELETAMNRAAEAAVPLASQLLADAVKSMTVGDAKKILTGGDTSVTRFFADKTRAPLSKTFLPIVHESTSKVGVAEKYDRIAKRGASMGLVKSEDASIDDYVTRKALDGLYHMIGEEEKKIRSNPMGSGNALIGKVFGALR